ncbi:MAG: hypothetical protein JXA20_02785 [Spirochaetes bacterium]|nr:hypothetical protein [Spirochaetota bacterium]
MKSRIAQQLMKVPYVRRAVNERADLSAFREKPGVRVYVGLVVIAISYIIGWPAVALFGVLSVYFSEPRILLVGGPAIYGTSHVVFWVGIYLAGARYTAAFFRWGARRLVERLGGGRSDEGGPRVP